MCDVRRHSWSLRFALDHAFGQPLEPFRPRLALMALPQIGCVGQEFMPRNQDRAAEEIIDNVDTEFAVKKQNANRFPRGSEMNEQIFTFRSENIPNLSALALPG